MSEPGLYSPNGLSETLRRTFIDQYKPDLLVRLYEELIQQLPDDIARQLPAPPAPGSLDLRELEHAVYMFA